MKKVMFTESQLQGVIKNAINEALGVPDNIVRSAISVYNEFMNKLHNKDYSYNKSNEEYTFDIPINITIGDHKTSKIIIDLQLHIHPQIKEITLLSMGFVHGARIEEAKYKVVSPKIDEVHLQIVFGVIPQTTTDDIIPYIEKDENRFISVVTHELKHSYDTYKIPHKDPRTQAKYKSLSDVRSGVPPMDEFLHFIYFTHQTENLVRPSEVSSRMASNRTTQETFRNFIENDETYVMLKKISQFSFDEFYNSLKNYINQIINFFKHIGYDSSATKDYQIVNEFLTIVYKGIINANGSALQDIMTSHPMENLFGLRGDKAKYLNKYIESVAKFQDNPIKYYIYESNNFKKVSELVMRKLRKLYAELPSPPQKQKSQSIYEWDLYHQVFPPKKNYFK